MYAVLLISAQYLRSTARSPRLYLILSSYNTKYIYIHNELEEKAIAMILG